MNTVVNGAGALSENLVSPSGGIREPSELEAINSSPDEPGRAIDDLLLPNGIENCISSFPGGPLVNHLQESEHLANSESMQRRSSSTDSCGAETPTFNNKAWVEMKPMSVTTV